MLIIRIQPPPPIPNRKSGSTPHLPGEVTSLGPWGWFLPSGFRPRGCCGAGHELLNLFISRLRLLLLDQFHLRCGSRNMREIRSDVGGLRINHIPFQSSKQKWIGIFRRTILQIPPKGGRQWLLLGFYNCVHHVPGPTSLLTAHLVLENDDVLQAHNLLASQQVPRPREGWCGASQLPDWNQGATAAKCSEVWGCGQVSLPAGRNQELAAFSIWDAFLVLQFSAYLF